jgi:hypothetical protein
MQHRVCFLAAAFLVSKAHLSYFSLYCSNNLTDVFLGREGSSGVEDTVDCLQR